MLRIIKENEINRFHLSGDLNRVSIPRVKENILKSIEHETKEVEFYFEDVNKIDSPAMAMIIIVVKNLLDNNIKSKVKGLKAEHKDLATVLGLHLIAEIESEPQIPKIS
ncbi:MAG: STAS domain-containing protein [Thermodesulfobacteriota bacterium]|nr:STAS domain-containing protein [Thermodesulfobacteriota bacterium]